MQTVKTDQNGWMPRLTRNYAECTYQFDGFLMMWLKSYWMTSMQKLTCVWIAKINHLSAKEIFVWLFSKVLGQNKSEISLPSWQSSDREPLSRADSCTPLRAGSCPVSIYRSPGYRTVTLSSLQPAQKWHKVNSTISNMRQQDLSGLTKEINCHFSDIYQVWTQWVSCNASDAFEHHINFAQDPLHSYFDECQKKEIHLLYLLHIIFISFFFFFHYLRSFEVNLVKQVAKKSY